MRAVRFAVALVAAALAAGALACGEDPVPKLEAERAALLERTRPKAEFWSEVERKGTLAKEKLAIQKERDAIAQRAAATKTEQDQLDAALAQARGIDAQTAAALAHDREEVARLEREAVGRAATLEGLQARNAEPTP